MPISHRGLTSTSTYFITASTYQKTHILQSDRMTRLFIEVLYRYREQGQYLLHEFVVMPNHFHLLITPQSALERAVQYIKGGFSYRAGKELHFKGKIWQPSYYDRRVRDGEEYGAFRHYIWNNPVKRGLVEDATTYPYSSANAIFTLDPIPQRLKAAPFLPLMQS
jgi:putative transposase